MLNRLFMQRILGLFWLADGVFQLKPEMFTKAFVELIFDSSGSKIGVPQSEKPRYDAVFASHETKLSPKM